MNKYYGLYISLIAGLSTVIGYLSVYIKGDKDKIISKSLCFASGVMFTLSVVDLLPTSLTNLNKLPNLFRLIICIICFFIGFYFSHIIRKKYNGDDNLYKTGIFSMIGIIMHNIPEGIATYILSSVDIKIGLLFALAIIFHNIPEGITIAIPIYYSTNSKSKAFLYTFISGISESFGALISMIVLYKYISETTIGILFSLIAGIMIYISFELLNLGKKNDNNNLLYFMIGSIFILFIEIIIKM